MGKKYWIQKATRKHKGSLKRWSKEHGFIKKNGNIDLKRAGAYAKRTGNLRREREVNLAKNLRKFDRV